MNPENYHTHALSPLNDVIVFFVTVTVCTFFLTAACTFTKTTAPIDDITPRAGYAASSATDCFGSGTRIRATDG